jgi:predicted secreted protein
MAAFIHYVVLVCTYAVLWFLCLFCLFPIGLGAVDPDTGAPLSPMIGRKALWATFLAAVLWLGFFAAIRFGLLDL